MRLWLVWMAVAVWLMTACARGTGGRASSDGVNLLGRARIVRSEGMLHPERLTDGVIAVEGDHWQTDLTSVGLSSKSFVEFDLGQPLSFTAALLQGDNNDQYTLHVSDDGQNWRYLWAASQVGEPGLRTRSTTVLAGKGRYVKLTVGPGDTSFSVSEVGLFAQTPAIFPPRLTVIQGVQTEKDLRNKIVLFGLALVLFSLLTTRQLPIWWNLVWVLLPLAGGWELWRALAAGWPPGQREISLVRGVVGTVAAVVIAREVFLPPALGWLGRKLFRSRREGPLLLAQPWCTVATLAVSGVLALATFANLGHPQFWDYKLGEPSRVHNFDMRVYYPVAKYFKELQYDGLYQGSVMAYVDDTPGLTLDGVGHVTIRDLKTHQMTRTHDIEKQILAVKARFSPERWREFVGDMRYFRETMGIRDYLGSMHDHGGNATPVWMVVAHLLFFKTHASNAVLLLGALLDPLLLIGAFIAIGRVFGVRTMLLSMVVFGANDYYMFGSNWFGATLRHDWMALLAFGACAIKREKWMLGGAMLAWSALIRAFPGIALAAVMVPAVAWIFEHRKTTGKFPSPRILWEKQQPVLRILAGAAICTVAWFTVSTAMLGFDAWLQWAHKIKLLATGPHVNHVSLRAVVAYDPRYTFEGLQRVPPPDTADWGVWQERMLFARRGIYAMLIMAFVAMVASTARRRPLEMAAVLGLVLIPIVSYPANYYAHFVFLLPLLAVERPWKEPIPVGPSGAVVWIMVTAMCGVQYFTVLAKDLDMHFNYASLILVLTLTAVLVTLLVADHYQYARPAVALAGAGKPRLKAKSSRPQAKKASVKAAPPAETSAHPTGELTPTMATPATSEPVEAVPAPPNPEPAGDKPLG